MYTTHCIAIHLVPDEKDKLGRERQTTLDFLIFFFLGQTTNFPVAFSKPIILTCFTEEVIV